jgi:hypothetical protein
LNPFTLPIDFEVHTPQGFGCRMVYVESQQTSAGW